jgi:hypothetical protein
MQTIILSDQSLLKTRVTSYKKIFFNTQVVHIVFFFLQIKTKNACSSFLIPVHCRCSCFRRSKLKKMLIDDTVHFFAYLLTSLVIDHVLKSAPDTRIQQIDQHFYYPIFNVLNLFSSIIIRTLFINCRLILYTVRALASGF